VTGVHNPSTRSNNASPRGETVVRLAPEPAEFTLVSPPGPRHTTNNGHLNLPEKIASPQSDQVAVPCQSLHRATEPGSTLNAKLSCRLETASGSVIAGVAAGHDDDH
jgi:hypothetical protein